MLLTESVKELLELRVKADAKLVKRIANKSVAKILFFIFVVTLQLHWYLNVSFFDNL